MAVQLPPRHLFTVDDYYRMAEVGILRPDQRVELIEGEIIESVPTGSHHASVVDRLNGVLTRGTSPQEAIVRVQGPIRLDDRSEPDPDITLMTPKAYKEGHPRPFDILLLVEVADSSLLSDQRVKVPVYARAAVPEVWIVNLTNESIEVYLEPSEGGYANQRIVMRGEHLNPSAFPSLSFLADEVLG